MPHIFWIKFDKSSHCGMIGEAQLPGDVMIGLSRQPRQAACILHILYYTLTRTRRISGLKS